MKNIDPRDFSSMMEGLDIGTQPAANEGAPFTGDNQTSTIQNDGVYNEILNAPTGSYIEEMPFETTEELLKLSKSQEDSLNEVLKEFSEEDSSFSEMIKNVLNF